MPSDRGSVNPVETNEDSTGRELFKGIVKARDGLLETLLPDKIVEADRNWAFKFPIEILFDSEAYDRRLNNFLGWFRAGQNLDVLKEIFAKETAEKAYALLHRAAEFQNVNPSFYAPSPYLDARENLITLVANYVRYLIYPSCPEKEIKIVYGDFFDKNFVLKPLKKYVPFI